MVFPVVSREFPSFRALPRPIRALTHHNQTGPKQETHCLSRPAGRHEVCAFPSRTHTFTAHELRSPAACDHIRMVAAQTTLTLGLSSSVHTSCL